MSLYVVKNSVVTSKYGVKRNIKLDNGNTLVDVHNGLDIISKSNDRGLYPLFDKSKVIFTTDELPQKHDGTGCRTIVLAHEYMGVGTLLTLYAHCDEIYVKKDDIVNRSKVIGLMGSTGNVSGMHLHCSMYLIPSNKWHDIKTGKYYVWDYATREQYQIDPNKILKLY